MEHFGQRLRELRVNAGLNQQQLSDATKGEVSVWAIRDLEQGRRSPTWETVCLLADALGVECTAFREEPSPESAAPRRPGRPRKDATPTGVVDPDPTASGFTAGQEGQEREDVAEVPAEVSAEERDDGTNQPTVEAGGPQAEGGGAGEGSGKKRGRKKGERNE